MNKWLTLSRQDLKCSSYLRGSFSGDYRAIPQRRADLRVDPEFVTFQLVRVNDICRPSWLKVWWQALRPGLLAVSLGPTVSIWALYSKNSMNFKEANISLAFAIFSLMSFQLSLHLFNDYYDHMTGRDRGEARTGSRIIQEGWLPAYALKNVAMVLLVLSILLAGPALYDKPWALWMVGAAGLLGGLEVSYKKLNLQWPGLQEVILVVLTGPLLSSGIYYLLLERMSWQPLVLGSFFGLLTLMAFHLNRIEEIFPASQSGRVTLANYLGFERAKHFTYIIAFAAEMSLVILAFDPRLKWLFIGMSALFPILIFRLFLRVQGSHSFASSKLLRVRYLALRIHWLLGGVIVFASLFI